ncbi:tRNA (N6-isopentenyl adenosine(37)-C2)-methylthiotransferase MiaB [Peptococcaceae bacterium]|nr:tRNA (N6-isopentenyl adenosine(37)-C2)-methylthiotransferase MiaB [Peptococcaceae bacterium]
MKFKINKKYYIEVFGCQMAEHDAEILAGQLENMSYKETLEKDKADVILVVTCCVRQSAENKIWSMLGTLRKIKEKNPSTIICVSGCLPQRKGAAEHIKNRFLHIDLAIGTHNIHRFSELLREVEEKKIRLIEIFENDVETALHESLPVKRAHDVRAWVTIMYGCDNFCSYCIVPYVRGRERSREPEEIVKEVKELAAKGYKDITLLGQNVNSYGKGLSKRVDFSDLLEMLNEIQGIKRIRFTSSHPRDFTDKLVKAIASCDKVCEHIHLPFQAGSDVVLKKMNRGYTKDEYLELIDKIKKAIKGVSITTDIMVGFPQETEEDFEHTLDVVRRVRFDAAFMFVYNTRIGTPAAKMRDQVPENIKRDRIQRLISLQNEISLLKNRELKGKTVEVLVESEAKEREGWLCSRTRTNKLVFFKGEKSLIGELPHVRIEKGYMTHLEGVVLE